MFGVFKMSQAPPQGVPASTPQPPEWQLARSTVSQAGMYASSQAMHSSTAQPPQPTLPPFTAATAAILGRALVTESKPARTEPRQGSFGSDIPPGHRLPASIVPSTPLMSEDLSLDSRTASRTINFAKTALLNSGNQTNVTTTTTAHPGGNNSPGDDSATDSDPSLDHLKQEHARSVTSAPANPMENLMSTVSTFHVAPSLNSSNPNSVGRSHSNHSKSIMSSSSLSSLATSSSESSDPSKKQRTYVLPDGTVLDSGKGLGRGRPGIKRGPRKKKKDQTSQSSAEQSVVQSPAPVPSTTVTPVTPQVSKKRKRSSVDESQADSNASDSDISILDDSDEYNPQEAMTRSGRNVARPAPFVPPTTISAPAPKKLRLTSSTLTSTKIPLIKKKVYRGREQLALCEHCTRGNGPPGNAIVFCDACNKCWHQRCHEPIIPKQLVVNTKAEWFCADCTKTLQKIAAKKGKAGKAVAPQVKTNNVSQAAATGRLIGASGLTPAQREQYLDSLPKAELVKIVLGITDGLPELPVFPESLIVPITPAAPAPETTTTPQPTGTMRPPPLPAAKQSVPKAVDVDDEDDDELLDEHARLYPKPGNGVASLFPPESEDLHILLEGPECRTFSHFLAPAPTVVAAA